MDCWALVRAELPHLPLDRWTAQDAPALEAHRDAEVRGGRWAAAWPPAPGDVLLMGIRGDLSHAGVCVEPGRCKHWTRRHGVVVQSISAMRCIYSRMEAWRWVG